MQGERCTFRGVSRSSFVLFISWFIFWLSPWSVLAMRADPCLAGPPSPTFSVIRGVGHPSTFTVWVMIRVTVRCLCVTTVWSRVCVCVCVCVFVCVCVCVPVRPFPSSPKPRLKSGQDLFRHKQLPSISGDSFQRILSFTGNAKNRAWFNQPSITKHTEHLEFIKWNNHL